MPETMKLDWGEFLGDNRRLAVINSTEPEYRLAWRMQRDLGLEFSREKDLTKEISKGVAEVNFAYFLFMDKLNHTELRLLKNREGNMVWLNKLSNMDYLLIARDYDDLVWAQLIDRIATMEGVLLCQDMSLPQYLNDPYLIF